MKESNAMSRYSKTMSETMEEVRANEERLLEVSPPGFKGTVKAMKKHDDIDNPYALAWHMKNKGDEAHYKSKDGKPEKKEKYKEDVDEAKLPPHLAKFFDKKGNPKPEVAKRMSDAARKKKVVSKDVTPKGYGPREEVQEGTWAIPDTQEKYDNLMKMMKRPIPAKGAEKKLFDVIGDDEVWDNVEDLMKIDPKGDIRPIIKDFFKEPRIKDFLKKKGIKEEIQKDVDLDEAKGLRYKGAPTELRARQLVDPSKETLIVKKNKVVVIDKADEESYLKKGWQIAEAKGLRYKGAPAELKARQLVDSSKETLIVKKNKVVVIDKRDEGDYLKKGWKLAETIYSLDIEALHTEALQENETLQEAEWKVELKGLPVFYVPAKSEGEVRAMLKKQIKKPDDILSIKRA